VKELRQAKRLVLPGVGAFAACMNALREHGLVELVRERALGGTPLLGVCVGMQMLFEESEEFGATKGLGLIRGKVKRFAEDLIVPHVGWNQIKQKQPHALLAEVANNSFVYFVHSYYCEPASDAVVIGGTDYGLDYASVVADTNIWGVQFHPEKSQSVGLKILSNFAKY